MGEGLRPHYHQRYVNGIKNYYDHEKGCMVKKVTYRCMICGDERHEYYEYRPPPGKEKSTKSLENQKKKFSNHK